MDVHFARRADNGSIAEFARADGVRVRLRSYDRTGVVPHDLAHLVVEKEMRLRNGLWGSLAAGAEFDSAELVEGRVRHDHKARSAALRKENDRGLRLAELLVGAVLNEVEKRGAGLDDQLAAAWSIYRPGTAAPPPEAGSSAAAELVEWARHWNSLRVGEALTVTWPLTARVSGGGSSRSGTRSSRRQSDASRNRAPSPSARADCDRGKCH